MEKVNIYTSFFNDYKTGYTIALEHQQTINKLWCNLLKK